VGSEMCIRDRFPYVDAVVFAAVDDDPLSTRS